MPPVRDVRTRLAAACNKTLETSRTINQNYTRAAQKEMGGKEVKWWPRLRARWKRPEEEQEERGRGTKKGRRGPEGERGTERSFKFLCFPYPTHVTRPQRSSRWQPIISSGRRYPLNHAAVAPTLGGIAMVAPTNIARRAHLFGSTLADWRLIEKEPYRVLAICAGNSLQRMPSSSCNKNSHSIVNPALNPSTPANEYHSWCPSGCSTLHNHFPAEWFADHMDHTLRLVRTYLPSCISVTALKVPAVRRTRRQDSLGCGPMQFGGKSMHRYLRH
ncbi:hypothetical protein C8J57DRAFT_1624626 [Mycena rebaudengoi]|nr:hypothetical protein C8J57DRAFT_1624626 [Mycena rebaudengoi]